MRELQKDLFYSSWCKNRRHLLILMMNVSKCEMIADLLWNLIYDFGINHLCEI